MEVLQMPESKIFKEVWEVGSKLTEFGVTKEDLVQIAQAAVTARYDAVPNDPVSAAGMFSYIYGTRELRNVFTPKGWIADNTHNIESVCDPKTGVKIIFQNAETAAHPHDPRPLSPKGVASEKIVALATKMLFPDMEIEEKRKLNGSVWYFFVAVNGDQVTAELSRPLAVINGQFSQFVERIYILMPGDWDNIVPARTEDLLEGLSGQEFEISVTRK